MQATRPRVSVVVGVLLMGAAACRGPESGAGASTVSPSLPAPPVAGPPSPLRAAPDSAAAAAPPAPGEIELLHSVPCVVAVSSKVDNPKDFPEHLVDGKLETAWNGRTGDLRGFIAFRTPAVTRVRRISLTVGFDKGDLFTRNHRISRVRVSREGRAILERDLDPDRRGFQDLALDEPGGDFRVDVLDTAPGTEKAWRELVVSELRVFGLANGAPESPTHMPDLAVGSLDGAPARRGAAPGKPSPGPHASVDALCRNYTAVMTAPIDAAFPGDRYPGKIGPVHCEKVDGGALRAAAVPSVALPGSPFRSAALVRVNDTEREKARLVLETSRGFSLTSVELWWRHHDDPGCGHASDHAFVDAKVESGARGRPVLVIRALSTDVYWINSVASSGTVERAYACDEDESGAARCEGPLVTGRAAGWPGGWDLAANAFPRVDPAKLSWTFRKPPTLGPAGDLRLGP